jgi:hypothetical protein
VSELPPDQPLGPILDNLGVVANLDAGEQITDVLVIAKISDFDNGHTAIGVYNNTGVDWVLKLGLLAAAREVLDTEIGRKGEDY